MGASYHRIFNRLNCALKLQKLNWLQCLVLLAIYFEKKTDVFPSGLAETFHTSRGNMSHTITRLQRLGYVARTFNASDARNYRIVITVKGRRKAAGLVKFFDELQTFLEKSKGIPTLRHFIGTARSIEQAYLNWHR